CTQEGMSGALPLAHFAKNLALSEAEGLEFHTAKNHCVPPIFFITFFSYHHHRPAPQSLRR
ncbi:MAG: hypothetical protein WBD25_18185, partial [Terriglobales bacterium]